MLGQRQGVVPAGAVHIVRFMVINALGPAILSLLAAVLLALELPEALALRLCSGIYLVGALLSGLLSLRYERVLSRTDSHVFPPALNRGMWGVSLLAHAVQVANLVEPSIGLLLLGLWLLLSVAAVQFVAMLFLVLE